MIRGEHDIQCMPCSSRIISEMLPEINTMEKCDFLKSIIHSYIILFYILHVPVIYVGAFVTCVFSWGSWITTCLGKSGSSDL